MAIVPESIEYHIPGISPLTLMLIITWAIVFGLSLLARYRMSMVPSGISNVFEMLLEYIYGFADSIIGPAAPRYYPLFIGIFLFVLTGNLIGLVPGLASPTGNLNITLGLAIITFVYYHYEGVREHGPSYILHFFGPKLAWYLTPINVLLFVVEIISHCARVVSLSLRLFCNIFAKEALLGVLALLVLTFITGPTLIEKGLTVSVVILRPLIILLGLIVSLVQALIFTVLSIIYIAGAVSTTEEL